MSKIISDFDFETRRRATTAQIYAAQTREQMEKRIQSLEIENASLRQAVEGFEKRIKALEKLLKSKHKIISAA